MNEQWKTAVIGGAIGAVLAAVIVFAAGRFGYLPGTSDTRIHDYLLAHPDLLVAMTDKLQTQEADKEQRSLQAAVDKVGLKRFINPSVAYLAGPADAKNTFVEFFDYNCGHCRNNFPVVKKFYETHKNDTRFAFVDYPIFGDASTTAARASVATRRQGDRYIALHFLLMSETMPIDANVLSADAKKAGVDMGRLNNDVKDPDVDRTLATAHKLAEEARFQGTPTFIVNGKVHEGEITPAELTTLLK